MTVCRCWRTAGHTVMREYASFARAYTCGGSSARACNVRSCMHARFNLFTRTQARTHTYSQTRAQFVISCAPCALERLSAARAPVTSECARVVSPVCTTRQACAVCACLHVLLGGWWGSTPCQCTAGRSRRRTSGQFSTGSSRSGSHRYICADPALLTAHEQQARTKGAQTEALRVDLVAVESQPQIVENVGLVQVPGPSQSQAPPQTERDSAKTGERRAYCSCVRFSAASTWARFRFANFVPGASVTVLPVPSTRTCAHVNATTA